MYDHLITSIMEYVALCASLFFKNAYYFRKKVCAPLCKGIGLSIILFNPFKDIHFSNIQKTLCLFYTIM